VISAFYTCVFWKLFEKYFSSLFPLFFRFFFCVKRSDGKVASSGHPFSLSGLVCLCDLLCGTTSGRHLSSVRMVNPVGLYRIPPRRSPSHFIFLGVFCPLVHFFLAFYVCFSRALVLFAIYLQPRYVSLPFYRFILSFYA
jgi:hypothetical protein